MEGAETTTLQVMKSLEEALKDVSDKMQPLHERLGPALAALLHTTQISDLGTYSVKRIYVFNCSRYNFSLRPRLNNRECQTVFSSFVVIFVKM